MLYGVKVYIEPEDILNKLSKEDRNRFNRCVFTDVEKWVDGSVEISCLLFNDEGSEKTDGRYRLFKEDGLILPTK